jgi:hypothetical protein
VTTTVIMQPTFLPWLGYFALIHQADHFVFLNDVQFVKRSWQRRNQIAGPNGAVMLSLPVASKPSYPLIQEARLSDQDFRADLMARIKGCLASAPHWALVQTLLETALAKARTSVDDLNTGLIRDLCAVLGLTTQFHRAADLGVPGGEKSERLFAICQLLGADEYLSPVGSAGYLRAGHPFTEQGTRLRFQNFTPLPYPQRWQPFRSHMSVIDALAWVGPEQTRALILAGIGPSLMLDALPIDDHSET